MSPLVDEGASIELVHHTPACRTDATAHNANIPARKETLRCVDGVFFGLCWNICCSSSLQKPASN